MAARRHLGTAARAWWAWRRLSSPLRGLPGFLIIGAQRSGTSSLYAYVTRHPGIAAAANKEVHYFDWSYTRGTSWYRSFFPLQRMSRLSGEATPNYLYHPLVPERAAALLPAARLIAVLRDPVDRAYSHYHHEIRSGRRGVPFAECVEREMQRLEHESELVQTARAGREMGLADRPLLARGLYARQVERWLRFFPRERLFVCSAERLYRDPATVVAEVVAFLGLPPAEIAGFEALNAGAYPEMDAGLRRRLGDFFRPHNQRLYQVLDTDFGWDDSRGAGGNRA